MKVKLHYILVSLFLSLSMQAQDLECKDNLSIYDGYVKTKNYEEAYAPWKEVYENCPEAHWANFSYGERILNYKIDQSTTENQKLDYINYLLEVYDKSVEYFPQKITKEEVIIKKVLLSYAHNMMASDKIYEQLNTAFEMGARNFKNPKALFLYFSVAVDLYKGGKKGIGEVFKVYDAVTERITEENTFYTTAIGQLLNKEAQGTLSTKGAKKLKSYTSYSTYHGKILNSIEVKLGDLADCENLIPFYENTFERKKGDVLWIKKAVGRMFNKDCLETPTFQKLFDTQLELDPSADAFMYSGILKERRGDTKGAIADFNTAMELETDGTKKSNIAFKIASAYEKKSKGKARSFAQKALQANPSYGRAYLLIARLYASSANSCGDSPFKKRALYWKAADLAGKAAKVDPSLSISAKKAVKSYEGRAPTKEMIFISGMAGKTIYFKCWVGGSVVVPKLE